MIKPLTRFKNASPAVKASMALLFANLVLKGLSLISGPIFTRIMPTDQYGIVSTFLSWQSLFSVVITLNLSSGVFNNGMLDFKEDRDSFQFSLLAISSFMSFLGFIVFSIFKQPLVNFAEIPAITIYFMLLNFLFVPAYSLWSGRQRYEYKYKALSIITILSAVITLAISISGVLIVDTSISATVRIIAMESVSIGIGIVFYFLLGWRVRFKVNLKYCIYALKFNVPLIPHYLSMYVLSSSDRIMITKMISTEATAIYSVAYTVASVITIIWQSIEASLSPWIYEKLDKDQKQPVKKYTASIIIVFAVMCLFCSLCAPEIMRILAPESYASGIYVIPPVSIGVLFTAMYSLYMRIELFYKQTGFAAISTTMAALFNIVLNYYFINLFGSVAAGYTTMICYGLLVLFHYLNIKKKGYTDIIDNFCFLIIAVITIILSILISFLYNYPLVRLVLIILVLTVALVNRKMILSILRIKNKNC